MKWLFMQEPPIKSYNWQKQTYKYFDKIFGFWDNLSLDNLFCEQTALPWHVNKTYSELVNLDQNDCAEKKDRLSWITSTAQKKPGHKLRMSFKSFLDNKNFAYSLFGRGFKPIDDKFDGIFPYKYSIALENFSCNGYWTEKITDCFLSLTLPFYWGAKDILKYFPKDSFIPLDLEKGNEYALQQIQDAIRNNEWKKRLAAIIKARDLVLNKYQMFPYVSFLLKNDKNADGEKKSVLIPSLVAPKEKLRAKLSASLINEIQKPVYGVLKKCRTALKKS
jgi:hypothetical protein